MNKRFLIPLVLVVLGVLVPVVYAAARGDQAPEPPTSAAVEPAVEEGIDQEEAQENQQQDQDKKDAAEDEKKEQDDSAETAVSKKESLNKESQSKQDKESTKTKQSTAQSTNSNPGKQQGTTSGAAQDSKQKDNDVRVTVTIVGKNGSIMYNSAKVDVKEKGSVLDALYATGVSCKVRSDGYVEEISGLAENSSGEGWMYSVNGGPPPPFGANKCTLNRGDRIIWFYGNIGDQPPKL